MRTISENINWRPKPFSVLEVICSEHKDTEIGPNTLSTLFRLQRKKLLEEAEATTSTNEEDTETENSIYVKRRKTL